MFRQFVIVMLFVLISFGYSAGQTFLALDVTRITGFKRIRYSAGDEIRFKDDSSGKRYKGTIVGFRDSLILFAGKEVNLKDIKIIYRNNENFVWVGSVLLSGSCSSVLIRSTILPTNGPQ